MQRQPTIYLHHLISVRDMHHTADHYRLLWHSETCDNVIRLQKIALHFGGFLEIKTIQLKA